MNIVEQLVEIKLNREDDFLKIKETLTRIGIASRNDKKIYQSCHILHKQGRYYLVHFKELFMLDGKNFNFTDDDKARRNTIAKLLQEWGLLQVVDGESIKEPTTSLAQIKVLPFKEKGEWTLISKYSIGRKF